MGLSHRGTLDEESVMSEQIPSGSTTPRGRHDEVIDAERQRFGGIKFGAAFFGWLAATGMAVLLTAVLSAIGVGVGLATQADPNQVAEQATESATTVGIVGAVVFGLIVLVSYFCGGYVAGRMARFDGAKQGVAVWLWAIVIAIVLALVGLVAGSQFDLLGQLSGLAGVPVDPGSLTTGGVITVVVAAVLALIAAVLGGLVGMRFHRRVDRHGLDQPADPNG
jgi:MFS family permease